MDDNTEELLSSNPDLYRHTPVRYLGYANEVGEAFRALIGRKWVLMSYGIATTYVLADTVDKTIKSYQDTKNRRDCVKKTTYVAFDTLTWQMLASVAIPGYTINRICHLTSYGLEKVEIAKALSKNRRQLLVTAIGLAVIPVIIHPIDKLVDVILDKTYRKFKL